MKKIRIDSLRHPLYASFKELYSISFPLFEQRTSEQQESAFTYPNYHLMAYCDEGVFIGFIAYWEFDTYLYIEHFAVNQAIRGKGYGSRILQQLIAETPKQIVLEIDPVVDDISKARLKFYKRCNFFDNTHAHTHPPYRSGNKGHQLVVLTTQREITTPEYARFNNDLIHTVMSFS